MGPSCTVRLPCIPSANHTWQWRVPVHGGLSGKSSENTVWVWMTDVQSLHLTTGGDMQFQSPKRKNNFHTLVIYHSWRISHLRMIWRFNMDIPWLCYYVNLSGYIWWTWPDGTSLEGPDHQQIWDDLMIPLQSSSIQWGGSINGVPQ